MVYLIIYGGEDLYSVYYILDRVSYKNFLDKTPYEFWKNRKPSFKYFKVEVFS
jgi:hypothetical protein